MTLLEEIEEEEREGKRKIVEWSIAVFFLTQLIQKLALTVKRQRIRHPRKRLLPFDADDQQFYGLTRMTKEQFWRFHQFIAPNIRRNHKYRLRSQQRLFLFLCKITDNNYLQDLARRTGISASAIRRDFYHILNVITIHMNSQIQYPIQNERLILQAAIPNFPGCISSVDATLVPIDKPQINQSLHYCARKKIHARIYQAMTDHRGKILQVLGGINSVVNDRSL